MTTDAVIVDGSVAGPGRDRRSLPLERKLPLLILAILTLVLATSLGISYYEVRRSAQLSAGERLTHLSHALASLMQQTDRDAPRHDAPRRDGYRVVNAFATPDREPSLAAKRAMARDHHASATASRRRCSGPPTAGSSATLRLEQASDVDRLPRNAVRAERADRQ